MEGACNCKNLLKAISAKHLQCMKKFITRGASVNEEYNAPLETAVGEGYVEGVKFLVEAGADVNKRFWDLQTPIAKAAESGFNECVEALIAAGADLNKAYGQRPTALMSAAKHGHTSCLQLLVDAGADVNIAHPNGTNALKNCALYRRHKDVEILLKAGADVNMKDNSGTTALAYAIALDERSYKFHMDSIGFQPLPPSNVMKCALALLEAGADVNITGSQGFSALTMAGLNGYNEILQLFIDKGGDVNIEDNMGGTPLMAAASVQYAQTLKILLRAGAKINRTNSDGNNAMKSLFDGVAANSDASVLLYAAGEKIVRSKGTKLPEFLRMEEENCSLKHLCREAIRKHLIDLEPHQHLFGRIPQLGLPPSLSKYLLYYLSLDE